jgi:hypothetical protein
MSHACEHCLDCGRGTHNFFKHRNLVYLFAESQIFALCPILRLFLGININSGSAPSYDPI